LYYADGTPYASYLGGPLAAIPIAEIASLKIVCADVPERNMIINNFSSFSLSCKNM
jgi:hypothetical protein